MFLKRKWVLLVCSIVMAGGSLILTTAYGLHIRSDSYRREVERELAEFFRLPCEIDRVRARTFSSRAFEGVSIHLPEKRARVFDCRKAIWHEERINGRQTNRLDLFNGALVLGSDQWRREDYWLVFESGMGHDFAELSLTRVQLADFEVAFRRNELDLRCKRVEGDIDMSGSDEGVARLHAMELNGVEVREGVSIVAHFAMKNGLDVTDVTLDVPVVPLASLGLESAVDGEITRGRFSGTVRYENRPSQASPETWVSGQLEDASLSELTRRAPLGPYEGNVSVNIEAARFSQSTVTHLRGRGRVTDLAFHSFAPLLGVEQLSGEASITLDPIDLSLGSIHRMRLEGVVRGVLLQDVLGALGTGAATGRVVIWINNVDFVENAIKSADIEVAVVPVEGQRGTISRGLVLDVAKRFFNFTWPESIPQNVLPESLEYAEFGLRAVVRDNQLRILGTHGEKKDVILTIKLFGRNFGIVREQPGTIDLTPHIEEALDRLRTYDPKKVRQWLVDQPN